MNNVTLVVTSCNRHSLLQRTLSTLSHNISEPFAETIIIEDSNLAAPAWVNSLPMLGKVTWITNGERKGQFWCCDKAWQYVKTPYVFWCEDDWEFNAPFLKESLAILEKYPEIITVSLRGAFCNGHPLVDDARYPFRVQQPGYQHFGCFTLNPGLRRTSDYRRIGSYGKYTGYHVRGTASEKILSDLHQKLDYLIASLPPDSKQIIEHTGHGNSKQKEYPPAPPKILIAVAACHQYRYAQRASEIHYDTQPPRIDAARNSWLKEVKPHSHYIDYKFFYGTGAGEPRHDEVFLACGDTYEDLPNKVKEICRYALKNGYDYVYKCDDDTFCHLDRLLLSDFRLYDQYGYGKPGLPSNNYITGGCGYTLSKAAMAAVVNEQPNHWAEDLWVGSVMRKYSLKRGTDARFVPGFEKHYVDITKLPEDYIACHAVKPEDMEKLCQFLPTSVKTIMNEKPSPLTEQPKSVVPNAVKSPNEAPIQKSQQSATLPTVFPNPQAIQKATDYVVHLCAGLGNQMFMYAMGEGLAARTGKTVRYHFEDKCFNYQLAPFMNLDLVPRSGNQYKEHSLLYDPAIFNQPNNTYFTGCWQNEKYFQHIEAKIREQFTLNFPHLEPLAEKLANEDSVAVGVRRGDYLLPDKVVFHGNLGPRYYNSAYNVIRQQYPNAKFYLFSDDPEWCSENMEGTVLDGNQYEHLYLFSKCRNAIIANSTFHWWGAWLGQCNTVAPWFWFRANVGIDIVPARWHKCPVDFV